MNVPATGTYLLSIKVTWVENNTGNRLALVADLGENCDSDPYFGYKEWVGDWESATSLPAGNGGGGIQQYSVLAPLERGRCIQVAMRQESGGCLNFDVAFSAAMQ